MYTHIDNVKNVASRRCSCRLLLRAALFILLLVVCASSASADEIYFTSGYSQTGVVIRETDHNLRFRTEMGMSTISREKVSFIEKATPEETRLLLKTWREQELKKAAAAEARMEAERKFEQEQIAKGLLLFEGKWMTPEKKQEILDLRKQDREHYDKFEAEQRAKGLAQFEHIWVTPELAEELETMESEIFRLHDNIMEQEELVDSYRAAMLNVSSLEEADEFSKRIEEITITRDEIIIKLNKLLKRADDIEATGVTYEMPEKFLDAFATEEEEAEEEPE